METRTSSDSPKRRKVGKQQMQEVPSSSRDVAQHGEVHMEIDMILKNDTGSYVWDDVNNMELPVGAVQEARKEEMRQHEREHIQGCEADQCLDENGEASDQYEMGRHLQVAWSGENECDFQIGHKGLPN